MTEPTHALTVLQPWAGLIAAGVKTVEFRKQRTRMVGKRIAIRSGVAKIPCSKCPGIVVLNHCDPEWPRCLGYDPESSEWESARGAILAVATIAECWRPGAAHADEPGYPPDYSGYAWVLSDVQALSQPLEWTPKRGAQVWAKLPPEVAAEVEMRVTE